MARAAYCLVVVFGFTSMVMASPSRRPEAPSKLSAAQDRRSTKSPAAVAMSGTYQMVDTTEIILDGKACKYAQVPGDATIVELEVAADKKTILKIHFRSK